MALTNDAEKATLDWLTGQGASGGPAGTPPTPPVFPLKVRLCTSIPTDTAAGTEVTNAGGSGTYASQNVAFGAANASTGQTSNTNLVRFDNMPNTGVQGTVKAFEIWDSAGTPKRWWWATLTAERSYQEGDAAEFPIGQLVLAME
jgi:hypothetical protein